jgi:hypothetical protein
MLMNAMVVVGRLEEAEGGSTVIADAAKRSPWMRHGHDDVISPSARLSV